MGNIIFSAILLIISIISLILNINDLSREKGDKGSAKAWVIFSSIMCMLFVFAIVSSCILYIDNERISQECKQAIEENSLEEIEIYPERLEKIKSINENNYSNIVSIFLNEDIDSCYILRRSYEKGVFTIAIKTKNESLNWCEFKFNLEDYEKVKIITNLP